MEAVKQKPRQKVEQEPAEKVEAWLERVRQEAQKDAEAYLKETEVPGGGE
jgi:hypothetical protein